MELATLMEILELARWAPSGDNTQPWRFEIVAADHVVVHGFDTREYCVYDLDGRASQLAIGALLETMRIAATARALRAECTRRIDCPETRPTFDVRFVRDVGVVPSNLLPCIKKRCVQRRPLNTRRLTTDEKSSLEASVGSDFEIFWLETWSERFAAARITSANAKIRLTIPEAFEVHRKVIEWGAQFSEDRIPDQALGLDAISTRLTRWLLKDWRRIEFFNKFLGGTLLPRLTLELIPGLRCAAHFVLLDRRDTADIDCSIRAGAAVQRFWLTATRLGLQQQPEMTPLIFARYAGEGRAFTSVSRCREEAQRVAAKLDDLLSPGRRTRAHWMGRVGAGGPARARSLRLPLERLMLAGANEDRVFKGNSAVDGGKPAARASGVEKFYS